jgi:serine/threonine protein kinase
MRILEEGTQLADRYALVRRLGRGAASESWLAFDRKTDAHVALKFLAGTRADDRRYHEFLHREWRVGSRLMHPHIVRVFEYHDDPQGPYFGQQFIGTANISVVTAASPADALRPIGLIADALRYAHGKGIIHRDIKAANILLDSRGAPYLVDFGVAAPTGSDELGSSGSPVALSPEQARGEAATAADDVYALGVLIHELLTGRPPTDGIAGDLPDGSPVPAELSALLAAMLSPAGNRPSAEEVAERLRTAGYPAGSVPPHYLADQAAALEVVQSVDAGRRFARRTAPQEAPREHAASGVSPRVLYGGLGAAAALMLAVVFVLPNLVSEPGSRPATPAEAADDVGMEQVDAEAADVDAEPEPARPRRANPGGATSFSENISDVTSAKSDTDIVLGDLLSQLERLRYRAIDRWGGQDYLDAVDVYAEGDQAYVDKNYRLAGEKYRAASRMLEPFFDRIDSVFEETLAAAKAAFAAGDPSEAVRLFDLAVAITPGNREAEAGLARAQKLASVLSLVEQGLRFEKDLELDAARQAFEQAIELDAGWQPAADGRERIRLAILDRNFEQRMTEGFSALAVGDFASARAAFNAARSLKPDSPQPGDGLLQVDQESRLADIRRLEREAAELIAAEQWETAVAVYEDILKIDRDLQFAQEGLGNARSRSALHARLQGLIDEPDQLSDPVTMQNATQILLDVARTEPIGPRLEDQKNELSRLLKRAATPVRVRLLSDSQTDVAIYKVGRYGSFASQDIELRPGLYVAVGNRPGYRDVRVEFRVTPEVELPPIVVQCEEPI